MPDPSPAAVDPRLTPNERTALERLLVSEKKGGAGWHRESSAAERVRDVLEAGETRSAADDDLLDHALRMLDRAA